MSVRTHKGIWYIKHDGKVVVKNNAKEAWDYIIKHAKVV